MNASDYFDLPDSLPFAGFFDPSARPWEWVAQIEKALSSGFETQLPSEIPPGVSILGDVYIHASITLPPFCFIQGPVWLGEGVQIRPGAYLRGNVIAGAGSVLGNSCEYKNCLLLEKVETPHFSYIGDSVLGNKAHLAAGVILSNLRLDQKPVKVQVNGERIDTGMRKLGALVGDGAEIGCNAVLMPGSIVGRRSLIGPLAPFKGTLAADSVFMNESAARTTERER